MRPSASAAILGVLLFVVADARAYVCSRVSSSDGSEGPSLSWYSRQVTYTLFTGGTADISAGGEEQALGESFDVWADLLTGTDATCVPGSATDFVFFEQSGTSEVDRVGYDFVNPDQNENLMIFRDEDWPHGSKVIALTTTTYSPLSGEILDADIEFNTEGFDYSVGDGNVSTDLKNTAVHEIGHLLGLAHTTVRSATMFAEAGEGETKKRDLACDDRDAMDFKYPADAANGYCDPPEESCGRCAPPLPLRRRPAVVVGDTAPDGEIGGCAAASSSSVMALAALSLLALRVAARRARRRVEAPRRAA